MDKKPETKKTGAARKYCRRYHTCRRPGSDCHYPEDCPRGAAINTKEDN